MILIPSLLTILLVLWLVNVVLRGILSILTTLEEEKEARLRREAHRNYCESLTPDQLSAYAHECRMQYCPPTETENT